VDRDQPGANHNRGRQGVITRSDKVCTAIRARGGTCEIETLRRDLERRGFPSREFWPALTLALLGGSVRRVDEDTVEVVS
jgi:hypothetical protein